MKRTLVELDRAIRFYDDDDEEQAVEIVDDILGIKGLDFDRAFAKLKEWPRSIGMPFSHVIQPLPDGKLGLSVSKGKEADLQEFGIAGLIDLLSFRSKCFSAIMFGSESKPKDRYFPRALQNAGLVINLLPQVEIEPIGRVWFLASEVPVLGEATQLEMGLYMLHAVLSHHESMRTNEAVVHFASSVLRPRMAAGHVNAKAQSYWQQIEGFLARPNSRAGGGLGGQSGKGFFARWFGK